MKTELLKLNTVSGADYEKGIEKAAAVIKNGGLAALPTETVYGLAADALNEKAVKHIFEVKGRPQDNPLIVHVAFPSDITKYVREIPALAKIAIEKFMPGPFTAILPKNGTVPSVTTAGLDSVAVRCPSHKIMHDIIAACGRPIAAPSANLSGKPSPTTASHCIHDLDGSVELIADGGECSVGVESTVVSFLTDKAVICRPGAVTFEMLEEALGKGKVERAKTHDGEKPLSPGMKYRHYSPSVPIWTVDGEGAKDYISKRKDEKGVAVLGFCDGAFSSCRLFYKLGKKDDGASQGADLFSSLRRIDADSEMLSLVLSETPSEKGEGAAVRDRLFRAASHKKITVPESLPTVIAVTGPSGAGKSTVAKEASRKLGIRYIDCDAVANELIWSFRPLTEKINRIFGAKTRAELSQKVFNNAELLEKLNETVLPSIVTELCSICYSEKSPTVVDGATVIESGFIKFASGSVSITAPTDIAIKRITVRDGISEEQAKRRLSSQKSADYYIEKTDFNISNDADFESAVLKAEEIFQKIIRKEA